MYYEFKRYEKNGNSKCRVFECTECGYTGKLLEIRIHTYEKQDNLRKYPTAVRFRCKKIKPKKK